VALEHIDLTITEGHPVTWQSTLSFVAGDVQTTICENVPRNPPLGLGVTCTACDAIVAWTNTPVACQGGSAISGYAVERRDQISDWCTIASCQSTPFTDMCIGMCVVYYYRVSATNVSGDSKPTTIFRYCN